MPYNFPLTCLYIFSHPNQHPTCQPAVETLTAFKQRVTTNFKRIIYAIKRIAALCKEANVLFLCLSTASLTILFFQLQLPAKALPAHQKASGTCKPHTTFSLPSFHFILNASNKTVQILKLFFLSIF